MFKDKHIHGNYLETKFTLKQIEEEKNVNIQTAPAKVAYKEDIGWRLWRIRRILWD